MAAYGVSLAILWRNKTFAPEDAIVMLIIFGLVFPLLAWVTTLRSQPLTLTVQQSAGEMWLLLACLVGVIVFLVWGTALSETLLPASWLSSDRGKFFVVLARKLIVFVGIPFLFEDLRISLARFGVQVAVSERSEESSAGRARSQCRHSRLSIVCR